MLLEGVLRQERFATIWRAAFERLASAQGGWRGAIASIPCYIGRVRMMNMDDVVSSNIADHSMR